MMLRVPPTFFEDHLDRCGLEPGSSVACRRLDKPIGQNGCIDTQARILDVKHVAAYHHPEEN